MLSLLSLGLCLFRNGRKSLWNDMRLLGHARVWQLERITDAARTVDPINSRTTLALKLCTPSAR